MSAAASEAILARANRSDSSRGVFGLPEAWVSVLTPTGTSSAMPPVLAQSVAQSK
ncbi:MAG: hypothetical protein K0S98_1039 [Propionibacteriaceae bacterium]|nr:hypothetical protein [Propionibacteriaceae bacterium]